MTLADKPPVENPPAGGFPILPRPPVEPVVLTGQAVRLEPLDAARHASGLWQAIGMDPALWALIPPGPFPRSDVFIDWLVVRAANPEMRLLTALDLSKPGARPVGLYMLINMVPAMGTAEMGLVIGPGLARRAGATEAFRLLAGHVFETLGYRRLEWRCTTTNAGSMAAARRFGFTLEGVLRQDVVRKGMVWDTAVFSILAQEWAPIAARIDRWLDPANFTADGQQIRPLADI